MGASSNEGLDELDPLFLGIQQSIPTSFVLLLHVCQFLSHGHL